MVTLRSALASVVVRLDGWWVVGALGGLVVRLTDGPESSGHTKSRRPQMSGLGIVPRVAGTGSPTSRFTSSLSLRFECATALGVATLMSRSLRAGPAVRRYAAGSDDSRTSSGG